MRLILPCLLCLPWLFLRGLDFPSTPPVEPQNAAKTFHVLDGFEMQLIAAEPLVTDPVAITYDADGRAYVCEMNDYPYTDKAAHNTAGMSFMKPFSRVYSAVLAMKLVGTCSQSSSTFFSWSVSFA